VAFEMVPGVTSAIAAPKVAGIPMTHREQASSLTVVTGNEDPTKRRAPSTGMRSRTASSAAVRSSS
jgi:uroporphyrin-III C-methyltransferase